MTIVRLPLVSAFLAGALALTEATAAPFVASERIYLSGHGAADAVTWDFKLEHGRGSGAWTTIAVPSCWEQQGFGNYEYIEVTQNRGFYKTTFDRPVGADDQRILLFFEGVLTQAEVTVNGQSAGPAHQGGYYRFSFDITDLLKPTGNLLEVTVQKMADDPELDKTHRGDFWNFSGIFRPVYLKTVPREYIDWFAVHGDMDGSFSVDVYPQRTEQVNAVRATVRTLEGVAIGEPLQRALTPGQAKVSLQGYFAGVKLWSDEFPHLYRVEVELLAGGRVVHRETDRFGFRRFENIPGRGFFLNGRRFVVKGVGRQEFWPETGKTLTTEIERQDVELMKNVLNLNFVRSAHVDPTETFLDLCDELGILVGTELNGWVSKMPTEPGKRLIQQLVAKDANHPSLVQWNNGNHSGSNPELIDEYAKWDPQRRMVIRNEAKAYPRVPGIETYGDAAIDTRFYPDWKMTMERLAPGKQHTFFPNEALHALYDGGGGAALHDYYRAIRASGAGGGIVLWALIDEGIVRTDIEGFQDIGGLAFKPNTWIDKQGNRAPDGVVGPRRELEGSAYALREIFSPIQFLQDRVEPEFAGQLELSNEYVFTSLDLVNFEWELLQFPLATDPQATTTRLATGSQRGPALAPGASGILALQLPADLARAHALRVRAIGTNGAEVIAKTWPLKSRAELLAESFLTAPVMAVSGGGFHYTSGDTTFSFNPRNGLLTSAAVGGQSLTFKDGPQFVWSISKGAEVENNEDSIDVNALQVLGQKVTRPEVDKFDSPWTVQSLDMADWQAGVSTADGHPVIESKAPDGQGWFRWTVLSGGVLRLDYHYDLPRGLYGYAGIGFDLAESAVRSKQWLGGGPSRVWKNRLQGPDFGLWQNAYNDGVPGEVWDLPAFKGVFEDVAWARLRTREGTLIVGLADEEAYLGVLRPRNGFDPRRALWSYPSQGGLFVFNAISPVGAKWRDSREAGPSSASNQLNGPITGTVYFRVSE